MGRPIGENKYRCQSCHSTEDLLINSRRKTGIGWSCRGCNSERARLYRMTPEGKKKVYAAIYRSIKKYPDRQKARVSVMEAVKKGELIRPKRCPCCNKKKLVQAHHTDYTKPLEVKWLCRGCHADEHKKHPFTV